MIEAQVRALFTDIANGEPGASRVDTQLAYRRGRARLRWRRAGMAGTPVLAVAVIAALLLAGAPFRPGGGGVSPGTGPVAPRRFNPLVPYLSFGWLPAGDKLVEGGTSLGMVWLSAGPKPFTPQDFELDVYAAGKCHLTVAGPATHTSAVPQAGPAPSPGTKELKCSTPLGPPTMPITGRAPAIHGHRAFWGQGWLIWQYARNGWAELGVPITPRELKSDPAKRAAAERDAVTIADHVRYGAGTPPLLFPFQLTHLPSGWQVPTLTYVPAAGVLEVSTYSLGSGPPNLGEDGGLVYQTGLPYFNFEPIGPRANPCYADRHHSTVTSINGYRVVLTHQVMGTLDRQDLCTHARGLALFMSEFGAHPAISLADLFGQHLRLLGRNPAHWTPNPIG
jgi:hypothetical protein